MNILMKIGIVTIGNTLTNTIVEEKKQITAGKCLGNTIEHSRDSECDCSKAQKE